MPILVIDACLSACQAAVFDGARRLAGASEPMERGHQERLATMTQGVMARAGLGFAGLSKIAVTIGPGSFTGLRVGLAFAKGLALATGAPLAGIGSLAALAASAGQAGFVATAIDARRGNLYFQVFADGVSMGEPEALALADAAARLSRLPAPVRVAGPGAPLLAAALPTLDLLDIAWPSLEALGALALDAAPHADVQPLYLRAPDARPMHAGPAPA